MNELALQKTSMIFDTEKMNAVNSFAQMMAGSKVSVPDHLKGSPSDCMAICLQSIAWGMDPFAVAQKTHLVQGRLGYEAQLVSAVISSSTAISGGFKYEFGGNWEDLYQHQPIQKTGKTGKPYFVKGWPHEAEKGLWCRCGAILRGEKEITWGEKVYLQSIVTRNSTNWVNDPKQQMAYTAQKRWSRLYAPAVILGVYTSDEIDMGHAVVVEEPQNTKSSTLSALVSKKDDVMDVIDTAEIIEAEPKPEPKAESKPEPAKAEQVNNPEGVKAMESLIAECKTLDELQLLATDIKESPRLNQAEKAGLRKAWGEKRASLFSREEAEF